jgi:dipeptidyl aminopeptidase/acylaminoacyl peptidase
VRLYVAGPDGSRLRPIATARTGGSADLPWIGVELDWAPDGKHIAFGSKGVTSAGGYVIAIADVATGAIRDLTSGDVDGSPIWSPDGQWIAFSRGPIGGPINLGLVRSDGSDMHVLPNAQISEDPVSWAPDGSRIAASGPDRTHVVVIPIDASAPSAFPAPGVNSTPTWQRLP